jgi:hypothetical protein
MALAQATVTVRDMGCVVQGSSVRARIVVTNDRETTTAVAGAAWGWLYAADCVDEPSLRLFYARHAGMAPEDFCAEGSVP